MADAAPSRSNAWRLPRTFRPAVARSAALAWTVSRSATMWSIQGCAAVSARYVNSGRATGLPGRSAATARPAPPSAARTRTSVHHRWRRSVRGGSGGRLGPIWATIGPSLGKWKGGSLPYDRVMGRHDLEPQGAPHSAPMAAANAAAHDLLARMPKAELHLHLDGSLRPASALALARERGVDAGLDLAAM